MKRLILNVPLLVFFLSLTKCNTNILDIKERELSVIDIPNKDYKLRVVYMPSNATIQSSIQVRKLQGDKKTEGLLKDYERYNYIDTMYLKNDTTFILIIRDTVSILGNKPDTMIVKL